MENTPSDEAPKTPLQAAGAATSPSTLDATAPATFTPFFGGAKVMLPETAKAVTSERRAR